MWLLDALGRWTALQQHLAIAGLLHRSGGMGMGPQVCVLVAVKGTLRATIHTTSIFSPCNRSGSPLLPSVPLSLCPFSSSRLRSPTQSFVVFFSFFFFLVSFAPLTVIPWPFIHDPSAWTHAYRRWCNAAHPSSTIRAPAWPLTKLPVNDHHHHHHHHHTNSTTFSAIPLLLSPPPPRPVLR